MIHWQQTLSQGSLAGWRLLTRWPLIRSIIRLWWRLGMWGMSVRFSHLPDYPAPTLDSLLLVLSPSPAPPLTPSHSIIYSFELVWSHLWMKMSQLIWCHFWWISNKKKKNLKKKDKTLAVRWAQLHSKASCDAPKPVSHSIINKPYVPYLSMTNTKGRWGISQSDGSSTGENTV